MTPEPMSYHDVKRLAGEVYEAEQKGREEDARWN